MNGYFYLPFEALLKDGWFFTAFERLKDAGISVFGFKDLKKFNVNPHKASVSTSVSSGIDWFGVSVQISYGDQEVSLAEVRKAFLRKDKYVKLSDGSFGMLPEKWLKKNENILRISKEKDGRLQVSKNHINIIDHLFENIDDEKVIEEITRKKKKISTFKGIKKLKVPKEIKARLRGYQKEGVNCLKALSELEWGGILADDIGLGKTLQAITVLQGAIKEKKKEVNLVVAPTTLLFNWEHELNSFAPTIKFHIHTGTRRVKDPEVLRENQLILTSYSLLVKDIEVLKEIDFNWVILDESQAIKNPLSKRYKSARLLKARNRLSMTGTPVENNTFDLYAQLNFLNPGMLGTMKFFKTEFSNPIDRNKDPEATTRLKKLVDPFILRRTKELVTKELPEKVEDILYCDMDKSQRKVYEAFKKKYRDKILEKIDSEGIKNSGIDILQGLMKLRQVCNSPAILNEEEDYGHDSVKLQELMRLVREKTGQHKILVFSQFVNMLDLVRRELKQEDIRHEYLDGSTKNRKEIVNRFREDENCRVFLISLKAGGTGLNLVEADYVFLLDPWWNPAVENQAIDRTHRIGQRNKVFAYRLICKDTIEEKVLRLQERKKSLASDLITADENILKKIKRKDVVELFS